MHFSQSRALHSVKLTLRRRGSNVANMSSDCFRLRFQNVCNFVTKLSCVDAQTLSKRPDNNNIIPLCGEISSEFTAARIRQICLRICIAKQTL